MNDRQRVRTSHVEEHSDGTTISIEYEDLPLPTNDPHVRERQRNLGAGAPSEIITSFAASENRPATFPRDLPFLAGRAVYTTESPDGLVSPGARWQCTDPDAVITAAVAASVTDGWTIVPSSPLSSTIPDRPLAVLRRDDLTRLFLKFEADGVCIVQLLDTQES